MANSSQSKPSKKRKISRETQFNRAEDAARKERERRAAAANSSSSSSTSRTNAKPKKTKQLAIPKHRHRYKSFNDLLSSIHIDISRSSKTSSISGLESDPIATKHQDYQLDQESSESSLEERELYSSLSQTNFGSSLLVWKELNLSIQFQSFINNVMKLSSSLPMILHHLDEIKHHMLIILNNPVTSNPSSSSYLALEPILDLIPRLASDLNTEFLPIYPELLKSILRITEINKNHCDGNELDAARIVEKSFESLARIFRELSSEILRDTKGSEQDQNGNVEMDYLEETWRIFRPYLGFNEGKEKIRLEKDDDDDAMDLDPDHNSESDNIEPEINLKSTPHEVQSDQIISSRPPKLSSHTLRFSSEALAHLVRKSSPKKLQSIAFIMLRDVEKMKKLVKEEEEGNEGIKKKFNRFKRGVAGVWLEVVKSVDHRLHSKSPDLLDSLFFSSNPRGSDSDEFLTSKSEVIVLTLISIVHHTSRQHLGFLISHLVEITSKRLSEFAKGSETTQDQIEEQENLGNDLKDSLDWSSTLIGVRKGNRVDDSVKPQLFALLIKVSNLQKTIASLPSSFGSLSKSITTFIALLIPIGRIQDLVGNGMKSLEISSSIHETEHGGLAKPFTTLIVSLSDPELNWSSFNQFALPVVLDSTMKSISAAGNSSSLDVEGQKVLEFLNQLNKNDKFDQLLTEEGRINPVNSRWIKVIGDYVLKGLRNLEKKIKDQNSSLKVESNDINLIQLSPLFIYHNSNLKEIKNYFADSLRSSIQALLSEDYQELFSDNSYKSQGSFNSFYLLSCLFDSLNSIISRSPSKSSDLFWSKKDSTSQDLVSRIVKLTWKSKICIQSLSNLLETLSFKNLLIELPKPVQIIEYLGIGLMSGDDALRSSSVSILMHCEGYHEKQKKTPRADEMDLDEDDQTNGIYRKMSEVERVGITVEGIRDRNVRMRNLGRELLRLSNLSHNLTKDSNSSSNPSYTSDFKSTLTSTIKYLVSSFKLNFKPIWEESRKTLIDLSIKFEDEIWEISFNEMKKSGGDLEKIDIPEDEWNEMLDQMKRKEKNGLSQKALEPEDDEDLEYLTDFETEEEDSEKEVDEDSTKQFIDPQLTNRRNVIKSHLSSTSSNKISSFKEVMDRQRLVERLDSINYEALILLLYEKIPKLVEKKNKEFLDVLFERVPFRPEEVEDEEEEDQETDAPTQPPPTLASTPKLSLLQRRTRLCSYLSVFSKFSNPKALSRSSELHSYLYELCSLGDAKIQNLALDCVLTWKNPSQVPYGERMKNLLDSSKFRDELTNFSLSSSSSDSEIPGLVDQPSTSSKGKGKAFKESNKEIRIQENDRTALMPLLLRLLFGQMISRKGKNTSGSGQSARKTAILISLAGCPPSELETLLDLMLEPFSNQLPTFDASNGNDFTLSQEPPKASVRRQNGLLSLMEDVLKHLGLKLINYWPKLIGVVLNLTNHNSKKASTGKGSLTQSFRNLRALGLRRLTDFFRKPVAFDWKPFLPVIFKDIVSPRLELLKIESIQSPSSLMELIHVWSSKTDTINLLSSQDPNLLPSLFECFSANSVKPLVINRILDVVERALIVADEEKESGNDEKGNVTNTIIKPYVTSFLSNVGPLLQKTSSLSGAAATSSNKDELMKREISILSSISPFVTSSSDASSLLSILTPMVKKGNKVVTERTKIDLLGIFRDLLLLTPEFKDPESETFKVHYDLFSSLFATLRSRNARVTLVEAFSQFKEIDPSLTKVADWVKNLNAFSQKRLDEPDFDKRLDAFDEINSEIENLHLKLTAREWLPLLHNMIHFVLDEQELAIRSNAGTTLKRFVESLSKSQVGIEENSTKRELFMKVVYPGLKKSLKSKFELVRREVLGVLALSVESLGDVAALDEMRGLLADGDAEASFFNNIHHIQVHRRARALRRLGDEASKGVLKSKTISDVLAPLIGHFLNPDNVELHDPNLINETIACLGKLSRQLSWSNYNALLWKYLRLANEKSTNEKVFVRASMSILDGFHFSMEEETDQPKKTEEEKEDGEEGDEGDQVEVEAPDEIETAAQLAAAEEARARSVKVLDAVTGKLLPSLMNYLSQKDDTDDAVRLPIAVGVIKVAKCLPPAKREAHIHKLLNTLSNVLKSKAQDTRDLARETLWKVSLNLGPSYFPVMVKELRRSLTRGPQLAVLAFTVHALLVHMMSSAENALEALDQGIEDVVHVATEDIFGHTAEDRDDPGYKSKMREVRQSKSLDTFEQLAKVVVPHRMSSVLLPLRDIMQQTEIPKAMKSIDDVLKRVAAGINSNQHFDSSSLLVLCHTLISRNAAFLQPRKQTGAKAGSKGGPLAGYKFAVLLKRKDVEAAMGSGRDHYVRNAHRFVAFGLDLLITALRRARFDFADAEVLAKIDPMISVVGNTLYATEFGVLNLGLKATGGLLKCPVPSLSPSLPVFIKQIFVIVHRSGTAQSDITQTALKTLTSILRECKDADIKEKQLTELLALILPDLEEPSAQSTLFGLLRAIVSRKFVVPEVYDVMDKVAEMLVTNQSGQVRELCRTTFLQFLLDYPQGKGRLKNQMSFLAKNLSYVYESGRLSVMDLISAIFSKFSDDVLRENSDLFFVALVMVLANDESSKCRENGAKLLRTLIGLLEEDQLNKSIQMTHAWAGQTDRQELATVGMQVYGILLEGAPDFSSKWLSKASQNIGSALKDCAEDLETLETSGGFEDQMEVDLDWQLPYQSLQVLTKVYKVDPSLISQDTWDSVRRLLLFPHKWVRIASSRLLGSLYATSTLAAPDMEAGIKDPLGFDALTDCAKKLSLQLRSSVLDDTLSLQVVKNLLFIGKSLALVKVESKKSENGFASIEVDEDGNQNVAQDEEEDSEAEEEQAEVTAAKIDNSAGIVENPLAWLFSKLSHQARSSQLSRKPSGPEVQWSIQPSSILRWFAAMSAHLDPSRVETFLPHIITPIHRILDDETIKNPQMEELKNLATEVQELVQERVGTTKFAIAFQAVRKRTQEKRRERKTARLMQGITNPEAAAKRKAYKNDAKHASRKRKNSAFADRKERIKPLKRHRG